MSFLEETTNPVPSDPANKRARNTRRPAKPSSKKETLDSTLPSIGPLNAESPTEVVSKEVQSTLIEKIEDDEDDAEVCFICAETIQYSAVTSCNHRTCHICSLRIRALYKDYKCSYCKSESREVIFTLPSSKAYADYTKADIACKDDKLGISFEGAEIMEETMILLRFNCPVSTCDVAANGWPDLKIHVRQVHNEALCDLCVKNQKIFTHEHRLFTSKALTQHYKIGDKDAEDNGFKGHPECGFCRRAFYDDDELYKHCREKHERCHVCDHLENGPGRAQYFQNYEQLDQHFRRDHFVCPEQSCLEQKFVVFGSEIDLKAHQLEAHPHGLSGQALRDARKVNTSFAGYEPPVHARGNRSRRPEINFHSTDRGSNAPMSREQLALHRQLEYQQSRAQSTGFGYALSEPNPAPAQPAMQVPKPVDRSLSPPPEAFPALSGPSMSNRKLGSANQTGQSKQKPKTSGSKPSSTDKQPPKNPNLHPQEVNKHQNLLEKVQMITSYDDEKVALYKTNIAQYRSTNINATELIDNLWSLFKIPVESLGSIVTGSADVLDNDTKKQDLLRAWNDWKIKNRVDAPVSSSSMASVVSSSGGGQRILNIKNRASRTASQTASVWSRTTSQSSAAHDPIAQATQRLAQLSTRNASHYVPAWSASAANSTPASGTASPINGRSATASHGGTRGIGIGGRGAGGIDFPSLPESSRKRISTAQYFGNKPTWAASGRESGTNSLMESVVGPEDYEDAGESGDAMESGNGSGGGGAGKVRGGGKKKVKKQILFTQGLQRG